MAQVVARGAGRPVTFIVATLLVLLWAASGPVFGFSDTWQLVINTATTVVTFLMVFLIQNTQNRDTDALQVKIDELLRVTEGARLALFAMEELKAEELEQVKAGFVALGRQHRGARQHAAGARGGMRGRVPSSSHLPPAAVLAGILPLLVLAPARAQPHEWYALAGSGWSALERSRTEAAMGS